MQPISLNIAVFTSVANLTTKAEAIAEKLNLPLLFEPDVSYDYLLEVTPKYIGLSKTGEKYLPLYVDFLSGKLAYRRQQASLRTEALARALGLTHAVTPIIMDATAGLGRDSFILASLGFEIQLFERSPIISLLLEDGIQRALENPHVQPIVKRMHLMQEDALLWLKKTSAPPDLIYLDPMFPQRPKSALVKKEMRIFQDIIGEDDDSEALFTMALACATQRVVVKRPRLAEPLSGPEPSFSMKGSSCRFDIYLTTSH